jgi:hypothetical protein
MDPVAVDLLQEMLRYDPDARISVRCHPGIARTTDTIGEGVHGCLQQNRVLENEQNAQAVRSRAHANVIACRQSRQ